MTFIDHESVQSKRIRHLKARIAVRESQSRRLTKELHKAVKCDDWDAARGFCQTLVATYEGLRDDANTLADIE